MYEFFLILYKIFLKSEKIFLNFLYVFHIFTKMLSLLFEILIGATARNWYFCDTFFYSLLHISNGTHCYCTLRPYCVQKYGDGRTGDRTRFRWRHNSGAASLRYQSLAHCDLSPRLLVSDTTTLSYYRIITFEHLNIDPIWVNL